MRVLRTAGNVLIFLGATLLFFVFYEIVGTSLVAGRHQEALAETFQTELDRRRPPPDPAVATPTPTPFPRIPGGPRPIARIRIPSIDVKQIVVEGITLADLAWGPGHYPGTADVGARGSAAIAGHRTGWGSPFIDLDKLRTGYRIFLDTPEATYVYAVTGSKVVKPKQVNVLLGDPRSTATHKLTLTTCTPKYTSLERLIVWADLVETLPRAA